MLGELLEPVFYFLAYWTGKPVVRILSLGRLHVAFLAEPNDQGKQKPRHNPVTFVRDSKRYVDAEVVCLVGMVVWALAIITIWLVTRSSNSGGGGGGAG